MTETYSIVPADLKWQLAVLLPVFLILAGVSWFLVMTVLGSQKAEFQVDDAGLRLRGDLYGRLIPRGSIRANDVRIVNLSTERGFEPMSRSMGTGLPSYRSGWFHLANGERALLYVTDPSRVVYIPTTEGYSVLLSAREPERLANSLRRAR